MSFTVSWHFVWQDQGTSGCPLGVHSFVGWGKFRMGPVEKTMRGVLGGVVSALIGNVLLTGAA